MAEDLKEIANDKIIDSLFDAKLTERERDFILYYLDCHNITQSYLKAFRTNNKASAKIHGYVLFNSPHIQSALRKAKKILAITYDIDPSRYVEMLLKASFADIGDYISFGEEEVPVLDDDGIQLVNPDTGEPITRKVNKLHFRDSSEVDTSIIAEVKQGKDGISIKMVDKLKAIDRLRDFFNWSNKNNEDVESKNSLIEAINAKVNDTWGKEEIDKDLDILENKGNG